MICKQIFSYTKNTKNKIKIKIIDEHFENILRIAITCIKPDIDELVFKKPAHCAH